jgi:hypothetical protein
MASVRSSSQPNKFDVDIAQSFGTSYRYPIEEPGKSIERYPGYIRFDVVRTTSQVNLSSRPFTRLEDGLPVSDTSKRTVSNRQQIKMREASVTLYMPPGFEIADGVQYENINLGNLGREARRIAQNLKDKGLNAENVMNEMRTSFDNAKEAASGGIFNRIAQNVLATVPVIPENIRGGIRAGLQQASNPHTQSIFNSVSMRSFNFNFSMMPTSSSEAEQIKTILKTFRTYMYPTTIGKDKAFYKFPTKFMITMFYNGKVLEPKILPCYLTGVTTSFNSETGTFHKDGNYTQTNISLAFQEERTLEATDIAERGY